MRYLLPIMSGLFLVSPAFGQTVDADGAARLAQDLSLYIGTDAIERKLVTVAPEGAAFRITLDVNALAGLIPPEANVKVNIAPISVLAKPLADGKWDVNGKSMFASGSFEANGPEGRHSMQWATAEDSFSGVYDPALAAFLTGKGTVGGMTMSSQNPREQTQASVARGKVRMKGSAAPGGGVDAAYNLTYADFMQTVQIAGENGEPSTPVTVTSDNVQVDVDAKGYRTRELLDLLAFGVAHPDRQKLAANHEEFKSRLRAVMPLWNRADGAYRFDNFKVGTPLGIFQAQSMTTSFGMDGLVQNATLAYKIGMTGIVPPASVPAWTAPVMPTDIDLNISGVGFNLADAAQKIVDGLDFNRDQALPEEVVKGVMEDFMTNPPKVVISRSTAKNADTELAVEGEVTFPQAQPEANITVEFAGFDKMIENLQAASKSQPEIGQFLPMAMVAKGFGKALPDGRLQWAILAKADGSFIVNGLALRGPRETMQ